LIYFNKGKPVQVYNGKHNKFDLYIYIKRKINPGSAKLTNFETFQSKITNDRQAFIYFGSTTENTFNLFNQTAIDHLNMMFYNTQEESIYTKMGNTKQYTIAYYSFGNLKDGIKITDGTTAESQITKFIRKNTFVNLYNKLTEDAINEIFMKKQPAAVLFRNVYDNSTMHLEENLPMIAQSEPGIKFILTDLTGKMEMKLAKLLAVNNNDLPTMRFIDFNEGPEGKMRRIEAKKELTFENVIESIKNWKSGGLKGYYPSQSSSEVKKSTDNVRTVTSQTFHEVVMLNRKNVVVFYHTSWCTTCKRVRG
jgi:hypothetical protein